MPTKFVPGDVVWNPGGMAYGESFLIEGLLPSRDPHYKVRLLWRKRLPFYAVPVDVADRLLVKAGDVDHWPHDIVPVREDFPRWLLKRIAGP